MKTLFYSASSGENKPVVVNEKLPRTVLNRMAASLGVKNGFPPYDTSRYSGSIGRVIRAIRDNPNNADRVGLFGIVEDGVPRVVDAVLMDPNNKLIVGPSGGKATETGFRNGSGLDLDLLAHSDVGSIIPGGGLKVSESRNRRARKYATQNYSKENTAVIAIPLETKVETAEPRHTVNDHDKATEVDGARETGTVVPVMEPATKAQEE